MSHGPPPSGSNNFYGFNTAGMGHMDPMSLDGDEGLMSMLDASMDNMFNPFDSLSMNLDNGDDLSVTTPMHSLGNANAQSLATPDGTQFSAGSVDNIPGAGPSPSETVGAQAGLVGSGILTEFTKRRNWPAKVVEEVRDLLHILDANGRVTYVSPNITALTGHTIEDITGRFLKELIHSDDQGVFLADLNESIASGIPMRMYYRLQKKDGTWTMVETVGHAHIAAAKFAPNPNNQTPFCQAVLMMSRPYPTKNASLLDSFLEHKIENERLKRRIADLRREEADDASEAQRSWVQSQSDITQSEDTMITGSTNATMPMYPGSDGSMPPPERPSAAAINVALTRENLSEAAGSRPDSIKDKMARYEGASHADTIEMLTGLRYNEGERSRGITTGAGSPTLVKGDAGIAIPVDRDPRTGEKKKKIKIAEEYVCTDCGTLESPEWRKGPSGPKTLCNACGLRWAKKEKKRGSVVGTSTADH